MGSDLLPDQSCRNRGDRAGAIAAESLPSTTLLYIEHVAVEGSLEQKARPEATTVSGGAEGPAQIILKLKSPVHQSLMD